MLNSAVSAAIVAGAVSLVAALLSYRASTSTARSQLESARAQLEAAKGQAEAAATEIEQTQIRDLVLRRLDVYPELWRINIVYETNWVLQGRPKTREWATAWLDELNTFNQKGGLYFSQELYERFAQLRTALKDAIEATPAATTVAPPATSKIREIVYGTPSRSGLSTFLKDDIGAYRASVAQARLRRP